MKVCSQSVFLFLCDTDGKEESKESKSKSLRKQVDGVLVIDLRYENIENGFYEKSAKIPLVLINGYHRGICCNFVLNDRRWALYRPGISYQAGP